MRVVLYHPRPLPPRDYGGVERVVLWLLRGLKELGHDVTVAAAPGSRIPHGGKLLAVGEGDEQGDPTLLRRLEAQGDVIHFMAPTSLWNQVRVPKLLTVHGNGKPGEQFPEATVFLSQDHAARHGRKWFVWNGIDPEEFCDCDQLRERPRERFLFFSKTTWAVKNLKGAMDLAHRAGGRLAIAGGSGPLNLRVRAWAHGDTWVGRVSGAEKAEFLSQGLALVFPILWDEPFGLVVAESLMSGTPVLAFKRGSIPELLSDSGVGRVFEDSEMGRAEFVECIRDLERQKMTFDPEYCRAYAERNFHYRRMATSYEALYKRVIAGELP